MPWQGPGSLLQQSAAAPALLCGDEEAGGYFLLQAMVKWLLSRIILGCFAVLTFMQILISVSLASAASMAKVLQAPLQARPWSCLILC